MNFLNWFRFASNLFLLLIALWLFVHGMFLVQSSKGNSTEWKNNESKNESFLNEEERILPNAFQEASPKFDRMVFVLVDAFRSDFLFESKRKKSEMKFMNSLLNERKAFGFTAEAIAPTVTLPRIKALTSGGIPNFIDLLFNFNSEALLEENWLSSLKKSGKKIHFFGDDTWLRLFPNYFDRFEGTTSFYVADTVEVDNNVTRHIQYEFDEWDSYIETRSKIVKEKLEEAEKEEKENPWDVLILHYLGLDHIGHLEGPKSALMPKKQREMDGILKNLFQRISKLDEKTKKKTVLIFCSDHGMNELGNHGGSSIGETSAVLVLVSPHFNSMKNFHFVPSTVAQVDIVPTICSLLGISIPVQSLGRIIPSFFSQIYNEEEYLQVLHSNSLQQSKVLKTRKPQSSNFNYYSKAQESHRNFLSTKRKEEYENAVENYNKFLEQIQDEWTQSSSHDLPSLYSSVFLFFVSSFGFLSSFFKNLIRQLQKAEELNSTLKKSIETCKHRKSNQNISIRSVLLMSLGFILLCFIWRLNHSETNSFVSSFSFGFTSLLSFVIFSSITLGFNDFQFVVRNLSALRANWEMEYFIFIFSIFIYFAGLMGSSTIEEEHQTFYFVSTTFLLFQSLKNFRRKSKQNSSLLSSFFLLCITRIMRSWNQTGNKWLGGADIHKWLLNNSFFSSLLFLLTAFAILIISIDCGSRLRLFRKTFQFSAISGIFGLILFKFDITPLGSLRTAQLVYLFFFGMITSTVGSTFIGRGIKQERNQREYYKSYSEIYLSAFSILFLLLHKLPNAFLILGFWIQTFLFSSIIENEEDSWRNFLILRFLAYSSFFMLGNSNGISTIDISGAYTGLSSYIETIVGLLVGIIGFTGPLFFFVYSLPFSVSKQHSSKSWKQSLAICTFVFSFRSVILFLFSGFIIAHRHHLFIWSVFSPKYIYEVAFTLFDIFQCAIYLLMPLK